MLYPPLHFPEPNNVECDLKAESKKIWNQGRFLSDNLKKHQLYLLLNNVLNERLLEYV